MDKALLKFKGYRQGMVLLGILSLLQGGAIILQAYSLAKAVTLLFHGEGLAAAGSSLLLFAGAIAARHTLASLSTRFIGAFSERTIEQLRIDLMRQVFARGPDAAARLGSGKIVTLIMDGLVRIRTYVEIFPPRTMDMVFITFPLLVAVYMMDVISGLILTFTLPILIVFFILLGFAAQKMANKQWRSYQMLAHHFTDALRGLETLRFLGRSRTYASSIQSVSNHYRKATMRTLRVAFLSSLALDFFSTLSVAFVAVGLGLRLIEGGIGLQIALTVLLLAPEYFTPVRMLGTDYHASLDGKEALQQVGDLLEEASMPASEGPMLAGEGEATESDLRDETNATHPILTENRFGDRAPEGTLSLNNWLELNQVSVVAEEGVHRLRDITVSIRQEMRKVGIVGMSGSGKTTLLHLLSGFLAPTTGEIKVGWASANSLAYIPQSPYIFSGTLAYNVRFYEPELSDGEVLRALEQVGLSSLVDSLPNGIEEQIGEGGREVSGGQAHRIALARAIAGGRSVWLLDEPTAHLDIETELELKEAMLELFADRLVILATHRLHWMKEMDLILVMKDGQLVEQGTHEQLLAQAGYYAELSAAVTKPLRVGREEQS